MRGSPVAVSALAFAALLASLTLVVWRQSRALETLRELERLRSTQAVLQAERAVLVRRIEQLESRGRVVAWAGARLGMHLPTGPEIVILTHAAGASGPGRRR